MKAQLNTPSRPILTKKASTKALYDKKNTPVQEPTTKKDKPKPSIIIASHTQAAENATSSHLHKLPSPKTLSTSHSVSALLSPKNQSNEDVIKQQKSDLNKKTLQTSKIRKSAISKHEPIKKQFLSNLKSPKNLKSNTVQSQVFLTEKQTLKTAQTEFNFDLQTSIVKTQQFEDHFMQNQTSSQVQLSFLKQNSSKTILNIQQSQIEQLTKTSKQQNQQILRLKQINEDLERKLNKLKAAQDQHKKKLRQRISTFNEEGQEIKQLKQKILQLQYKIAELTSQNQSLRNKSLSNEKVETNNKNQLQIQDIEQTVKKLQVQKSIVRKVDFEIFRVLKMQIMGMKGQQGGNMKGVMIDESVMTCFEDSTSDGALSMIHCSSVGNLQQSLLSNQRPLKDHQGESCDMIIVDNMEIQRIRNAYEQRYNEKIRQMEVGYRQGLSDVEKRVGLFEREVKVVIKSQQEEILSLQKKVDQLYDRLELESVSSPVNSDNTTKKSPTLGIHEQQLKHIVQINAYKKKLAIINDQIKKSREELHIKEIECKRVSAQLDIERIKHSVNTEINTLKKNMVQDAEKERYQIILQQLKIEKQKTHKLMMENKKKQQLIKKLSTSHQQAVHKKIKK